MIIIMDFLIGYIYRIVWMNLGRYKPILQYNTTTSPIERNSLGMTDLLLGAI